MRIAVCDDNLQELEGLSKLLNHYREISKAPFTYKTYTDGISLLEDMRTLGFDFLLLDVIMPIINGMKVAHEVRSFNESIKIGFLTSSPEFAVESYAVEAFSYILKPATSNNLFPILDKLFRAEQKPEDMLTLKLKNGVAKILHSRLSHVEVCGKKLSFHLVDGSKRELNASLSDYKDILLSRPEFIRVHRAFVVNIWQIAELHPTEILTYSGSVVPVSRRMYAQVFKKYMEQLFS